MSKLLSNKLLGLLLALVFFGASQLIELYQTNINDQKNLVGKFENRFQLKEKEARKQLDNFLKFVPEKILSKNIRFYSELYDRKGIALFAYKNDTLVAWTENRIPLGELYPHDIVKKNCAKLGNGWYAIIKQNWPPYKGIALILIKNEYPYQNDYLKNSFQEDLGLTNEDVITLHELPQTYNLFFSNNSFVCGLKIYHYSKHNQLLNFISIALFFLALLIVISVLIKSYRQFLVPKINRYEPLINILLVLIARWIMLYFKLPKIFYDLEIFNPRIYAYNNIFPSLGDYILNSVAALIGANELKKLEFGFDKSRNQFVVISSQLVKITLVLLILWAILRVTIELPENSSLSFNISNLTELNIYGYLALGASLLFFISGYLTLEYLIKSINYLNVNQQLLYLIIFSILLSIIVFIDLKFNPLSTGVLTALIFFVYYWQTQLKKEITITYLFTVLGGVILLYTNAIIKTVENNDLINRKLLIEHLSAETDQVVEQLFPLMEKNLSGDSLLIQLTSLKRGKGQLILETKKLLEQKYFKGYWDKYDINYFVYNRFGEPLLQTAYLFSTDISNFETTISKSKKIANSKYLYHLKTDNGKIAYVAKIPIKSKKHANQTETVFILIQAKYLTDDIGFPELLLNKKIFDNKKFKNYSYAKYKNYNLISRFGKFSYPLTSASFTKTDSDFYEIVKENYLHTVCRLPDNTQIIVSTPKRSDFFAANIFSALLIYYLAISSLIIAISRFNQIKRINRISLRTRIQVYLLLALLFSFVILGYSTIQSLKKQFDQQNLSEISNKTRAILTELEEQFRNEKSLQTVSADYLNYLLSKLSNTFSTDITIFDKQGNLKASSRLQLFDQNLISTKINPEAYFYLTNQDKTEYLHQEKVGQLKYLSAYVPFRNRQNKLLGYINIPYFSKQGELESEISNFLISLINIYLILFALYIFTSLLISHRITYPLLILKEKISAIKLGQKNELIVWKGNDEIAALVNEYNRMVIELMNSAEQLAKTEREGAWKEMAKQVAHEIKNPLTPIKLSVQLLERAWKDKAPDFDKKLKRFSETLIEQIDTLSNIATQFSSFAQMPNPNLERVNLNEVIKTVVNLYKNSADTVIESKLPDRAIYLNADKDYLVRILNNLIKNATQAIDKNKKGLIEVILKSDAENGRIILSVKDNGIGISDEIKPKIFNPNFTTKTTGSGLGLAMVKNMTELMGGQISFTSQEGVGTEFTLIFKEDL